MNIMNHNLFSFVQSWCQPKLLITFRTIPTNYQISEINWMINKSKNHSYEMLCNCLMKLLIITEYHCVREQKLVRSWKVIDEQFLMSKHYQNCDIFHLTNRILSIFSFSYLHCSTRNLTHEHTNHTKYRKIYLHLI